MSEHTDWEIARFERGEFDPERFPHRDHVRLGFEMLRRRSFTDAVNRFACGLRIMAMKAGKPHVYHETFTVAYLSLIAERIASGNHDDFQAFAQANPDLFEKAILHRWYSSDHLRSELARKTFVLPKPPSVLGMSVNTWLKLYRWLFVGFVSISTTETLVAAHHADGHAGSHQIILGSAEMIGAVLFLFRRTQTIGAGILILVFAAAAILATILNELPARFLFYAGTVIYILVTDRRLISEVA